MFLPIPKAFGAVFRLMIFGCIAIGGCNVTLPNGVFSCSQDSDCPSGLFCHGSQLCFDTVPVCTSNRQCGDVYQCGEIDNGCGELVDCGMCDDGLSCGAGSHSFSCGCESTTCAALGAECGAPPSGCGDSLLNCGQEAPCQALGENFLCNASFQCACTPVDATTACANKCGTLEDGCGSTIECGGCTGAETCGGGGVENVCDVGECIPVERCDAAFECGSQSDGCDGRIQCGMCAGNDFCSDHKCECEPMTCDQLGFECGRHEDGCGGTLNCGGCDDPLSCGTWNARPSVCGGGCEDLGYECGSPFGPDIPECGFCEQGVECDDSFKCQCSIDIYDEDKLNNTADSATRLGVVDSRDFKRNLTATLDASETHDWYRVSVPGRTRNFVIDASGAEVAITIDHSCGLTSCSGSLVKKQASRPTSCVADGATISFRAQCAGRRRGTLLIRFNRQTDALMCIPYEFELSGRLPRRELGGGR